MEPIKYCITFLCMFILYLSRRTRKDMVTGIGNNLFGYRCSYFWAYPNRSVAVNEMMTINNNGTTCKAVQLNYISRHGARYPESDDYQYFDKMKNKIYFDELREKLVANSQQISKFEFLKTWQNYPVSLQGHVFDLGRWEFSYLGNMYGKGLYDLFNGKISAASVKLTASHQQRALTSAKEFYKGLTESIMGRTLTDNIPIVNDSIIRYVYNCPNYDVGVWNNKTQMREQYIFQNSSYLRQVIKNVAARLDLNTTLTVEDVKMIFALCSTDLAVRNNTDWCTLQTESEREILNYESDLESYYSLTYGHPLIPKLSCPLWVDIFGSFDNAISKHELNQTYVLGDLRFGHTDTLDPFYAALGLFKDVPGPRGDNFSEMRNRKFFESKVTPTAAHIAFVLYGCGGTGPENYLIKMMVNGKAMTIPGCSNETCPYLQVKSLHRHYIEHCNWKQLCTIPGL